MGLHNEVVNVTHAIILYTTNVTYSHLCITQAVELMKDASHLICALSCIVHADNSIIMV